MSLDFRVPPLAPRLDPDATMARRLNTTHTLEDGDRSAFDSFLSAAMDVINETNVLQFQSDDAQMRFATGQSNDMLDVILTQQRATSALNFTVQITNRIIEAYREIMRMQV